MLGVHRDAGLRSIGIRSSLLRRRRLWGRSNGQHIPVGLGRHTIPLLRPVAQSAGRMWDDELPAGPDQPCGRGITLLTPREDAVSG
jgi:hypothetical protein